MAIGAILRSRVPKFVSLPIIKYLIRIPIIKKSLTSPAPPPISYKTHLLPTLMLRYYHDGRPRGSLWRGKKLIGKEAIFVILGLKRFKEDEEKLDKFIKTHVLRLLKMDMVAVINELERQEEVSLAIKVLLFFCTHSHCHVHIFIFYFYC